MFIKKIIAIIIICLFMAPSSAFAAENTSVFQIGNKTYEINGVEKSMDTAPFIRNNRTYMPVRFIAYGVGLNDADIDYADGTAFFKGEINVNMTADVSSIYINGKLQSVDTPPVISDNRMFLPVRFIAEAFGAGVKWNAENRKVVISAKSQNIQKNVETKESSIADSDEPVIKETQNIIWVKQPELSDKNISVKKMGEGLGLKVSADKDSLIVQNDNMSVKFTTNYLSVKYTGGEKEVALKNGIKFSEGDAFINHEDYATVMSILSLVNRRI